MAFQELFKGEQVIGPDGESMKLGEFAKMGAPLVETGQSNTNRNIFSEDTIIPPEKIDGDIVKGKKYRRSKLYGILTGGLTLLGLEVVILLNTWRSIVDYIVSHY